MLSMFANIDRKTSFKLPPTTIRDKLVTQETRRTKVFKLLFLSVYPDIFPFPGARGTETCLCLFSPLSLTIDPNVIGFSDVRSALTLTDNSNFSLVFHLASQMRMKTMARSPVILQQQQIQPRSHQEALYPMHP